MAESIGYIIEALHFLIDQ